MGWNLKPDARGPKRVRVFFSLGANLGDRQATISEALARLEESGHVQVVRRSSVYETAPVGKTDQPWFVNLVAEIETDLPPEALLDLAQRIEADLGRTRDIRWGPRTIDIDVVLYGDQVIRTRRLIVPHPEMTRRRFVLEPLVEIAPDLVMPDGRAVADLAAAVHDQEVRKLTA